MGNGNNTAGEVLEPLVLCGETALRWHCCGRAGPTADLTSGGFPPPAASEATRLSGFLPG